MVKRVNNGKLKVNNVLNGWVSERSVSGAVVLQEFDLFYDAEFSDVVRDGDGSPTTPDHQTTMRVGDGVTIAQSRLGGAGDGDEV